MTSIKLILNKDRITKTGNYPLVFQLIRSRRKKLIYTPYKLKEDEFDTIKQRVHNSGNSSYNLTEIKKINRYIRQKKSELTSLVNKLSDESPNYTIEDLVFRYKILQDGNYLMSYMEKLIDMKKKAGKEGTAAAYISTKRSLEEYLGLKEIKLSHIDFRFVYNYEQFLLSKKLMSNTIAYYMRNLRSIYNQASNEGYEVAKVYPFKSNYFRENKTVKRALSRDNMKRIASLDLKEKQNMELSRDIFMFSFFTRGMSFVDIATLKRSNIRDGVISYSRNKTNQWLQITLTSPLKALIEKYDNGEDYIFPLIKMSDERTEYQQYRRALKNINRHLKQIGVILGISIPLTTYVARHSWATLAKESGAPVSMISEGLGHTSEKTTQIYLKQFDRSVLDRMNEKVTAL